MHFLEKEFSYSESKYIVVPAPLERSVSYGGGTKTAPSKIIEASHQLEEFDFELNTEPFKQGIHVLNEVSFSGDINAFNLNLETVVAKIINDNKIPIVIGGEHSISYPVFKGIKKYLNNFSILHFDAHLDLRYAYEGDEFSHASVIRRIKDSGFNSIVSFGIRSVSFEEHDYLKKNPHKVFYARDTYDIEALIKDLKKDIYITFDVDCLDPSIMPSTGTPEPGGYLWYQTLDLLKEVLKEKNLVALDVVELAPDGINHFSEFTIAKLIYKILGYGQKILI